MSQEDTKRIFLLGAGASKLVGIPLIDEMTRKFLANPAKYWDTTKKIPREVARKVPSALRILEKVTELHYPRMDLEFLMTLVQEFEDERSRKLFESKYPSLKRVNNDTLILTKRLINRYVRGACEDFATDSLDYLWPLPGLSSNGKMKIFTMNYDGSIEIFCDKHDLSYSDGFDPYWNPKIFDEVDIQIFKLHGSLYWLRSDSGKLFKVPLKGLDVDKVAYQTDEQVTEMMIYPALHKNKQSEVYLWLFRKLIDELDDARTCIVIGYSFRDAEIRENIIDAMNRNPKLWLVLVNPMASKLKTLFFDSLDEETASRIVTMDIKSHEAITDRLIHKYLANLETVKKREEEMWAYQSRTRVRLDRDWTWVLNNYASIGHFDRISLIYEKLSKQEFDTIDGSEKEVIENFVGSLALPILADSYGRNDVDGKLQLWSSIFSGYCEAVEYAYFASNSSLAESNPIKASDFLQKTARGIEKESEKRLQLEKSARTMREHARKKDRILAQHLSKFIDTLQLFTFKRHPDVPNSENMEVAEFLARYREEKLGLHKWSGKIVGRLYKDWL